MSDDLKDNYAGVFDSSVGFGRRTAVLVIDFINAYTEPNSPLYAIDVVTAVERSVVLLEHARALEVPVIYTRVIYHPSGLDGGLFVQKIPVLRQMVEGNPLANICERVKPHENDLVIHKQYASCFFGTSLASTLTASGVDTLILIGCSTSGCVRATAVDGMQYGFRVLIPRECVGDRHPSPHDAALFDINSKYGDVLSLDEALKGLSLQKQRTLGGER